MIVIIGGGLCGLVSAIALRKGGFDVTVVEKKNYPFHRVCGEYVSNEVKPYLFSLGIDVEELGASNISRLKVSSPSGNVFETKLDLGGFGISRFKFDNFLFEKAKDLGVQFLLNTKVNDVFFIDEKFNISLDNEADLTADLVIASYGKRSNLDQKLKRQFFYRRSPYFGVKYHIKCDFPTDVTQLDNFKGGYCGINKIEDDKYNLCYLSENKNLKSFDGIKDFEEGVLHRNPQLKRLFQSSEFLFDKPLVINEISFEKKALVENHILYCGDAAGMITPLCGNGMAMAIHGAKILAEQIMLHKKFADPLTRKDLEKSYETVWNKSFAFRLKSGRGIQRLFGKNTISEVAISTMKNFPNLANLLIEKTHGKPF